MLPIADPHRFGELQSLRSERFLRELDTIKRGIVQAEFEVERDLLLKLRDSSRGCPGLISGTRA